MDRSRELYLFSGVAALIGIPLLRRNVFNQPEQHILLQNLHGLHWEHWNVKATRCFRSQNTIIFKWLWLGMVIIYCLNIAAPTGSSQNQDFTIVGVKGSKKEASSSLSGLSLGRRQQAECLATTSIKEEQEGVGRLVWPPWLAPAVLWWPSRVGQAEEPYGGEGAGNNTLCMFLGRRTMKAGGVVGAGEVSMLQWHATVGKRGGWGGCVGQHGRKGVTG